MWFIRRAPDAVVRCPSGGKRQYRRRAPSFGPVHSAQTRRPLDQESLPHRTARRPFSDNAGRSVPGPASVPLTFQSGTARSIEDGDRRAGGFPSRYRFAGSADRADLHVSQRLRDCTRALGAGRDEARTRVSDGRPSAGTWATRSDRREGVSVRQPLAPGIELDRHAVAGLDSGHPRAITHSLKRTPEQGRRSREWVVRDLSWSTTADGAVAGPRIPSVGPRRIRVRWRQCPHKGLDCRLPGSNPRGSGR